MNTHWINIHELLETVFLLRITSLFVALHMDTVSQIEKYFFPFIQRIKPSNTGMVF